MKLVVGLGNPGREYEKTRHNIGFMVLSEYAKDKKLEFALKDKFKGELVNTIINNEQVIFLKPHTFMNASGESVLAVKQFYNIKDEDILVIHDDLDLPCGKLRIRQKGSAGGHNGLKSIISCINGENFHRLKIGIGRDELITVVDYVLGRFTKEQVNEIAGILSVCINIVDDWINKDIMYVMNKYN